MFPDIQELHPNSYSFLFEQTCNGCVCSFVDLGYHDKCAAGFKNSIDFSDSSR